MNGAPPLESARARLGWILAALNETDRTPG